MRTIARLLARLAAAMAVIVVMAGPVIAVAYAAGNPIPSDLLDRLGSRTVDDATILKVLSLGFYVCWAWFCIPAIRQLLAIPRHSPPTRLLVAAGRGDTVTATRPVEPLRRGPRGMLARLARFAVSGAAFAATVAGPTPMTATAPASALLTADIPAAVAVVETPLIASTATADATAVTAAHRDTPYAIAARYFPAGSVDEARNDIVQLNTGRELPDGSLYRGGTLPAGWSVLIPRPASDPPDNDTSQATATDANNVGVMVRVGEHVVEIAAADFATDTTQPVAVADNPTHVTEPGESYWSIAETRLRGELGREPDGAQVWAYTHVLIDTNAARLAHHNPQMLFPGDTVILVPVPAAPTPSPVPDGHVVTAGESYWSISTDQLAVELGREPTDQEVLARTEALMAHNSPRLAYLDPSMLHVGDIVATLPSPPLPTSTVELEQPTVETPSPPINRTADEGSAPLQPPTVDESPAPLQPPAIERPKVVAPSRPAPVEPATPEPVTVPIAPSAAHTSSPPAAATGGPVDAGAAPVSRTTLVAGLSVLAAAGVAIGFRRRRTKAAQSGRPHQQPARLSTANRGTARELVMRDMSDVTWMTLELQLLAHRLPRAARSALNVQLLQAMPDRSLEVAFTAPPDTQPPKGWVPAAERVWQLTEPHSDDELATVASTPPVLPALVTLGDVDGGQLYLNLETPDGIHLVGTPDLVAGWAAGVVWEIAGAAIAERPDVIVVDFDVPGVEELAGVRLLDEDTALAALAADGDAAPQRGMLDRRTDRWETWPPKVVVLGPSARDELWSRVAERADVAVVALHGEAWPKAVTIQASDAELWVRDWGLRARASSRVSADTAAAVVELFENAATPPEPDDELVIPKATATTDLPDQSDEADAGWQAPTWPVMVHVLGEPVALRDGGPLGLTPQLLSALAFIAVEREASVHELREAIWGDDDLPDQRLRDLLSRLRKAVGGVEVVQHVEDGKIRAGHNLGSDLAVFAALNTRANEAPDEFAARLHEMLRLVRGRPFACPSSALQHWRWVDLGHLEAIWSHRASTAAWELARLYLDHADADTARDIAERGLRADPLSAPLTETLMEAYAGLNAFEAAQRVYVAHDRTLIDRDLGGASEETRRVLERIRTAARSDDPIGTAVGS